MPKSRFVEKTVHLFDFLKKMLAIWNLFKYLKLNFDV